jgi:hypothetical protein
VSLLIKIKTREEILMAPQINPDIQKHMDNMKEHHAKSVDVMHKSGQIVHQHMKDIADFYHEHIGNTFSKAVVACKSMLSAKTPQDAMSVHKEWSQSHMKECMTKNAELSKKTATMAKESAEPIKDFAAESKEKFKKK